MHVLITGYTETIRRFTARYGRSTTTRGAYTMAILRILIRSNVLLSLQQYLPPLRLPFPPLKFPTPPTGLCRHYSHDHHLFLPTNLLHLQMQSSLAICLPRWNHHHGHFYYYNHANPSTLYRQIPLLSCFSLHGNGTFWVNTFDSCLCFELGQTTKKRDVGL